jgi:tetratricopeptide (TPR) repeat protein
MSIFGKLFTKRDSSAQNDKSTSSASDPANDSNLIRVFDEFGQEFFISKEEWRTNVLPGALKSHWDRPDELCETIISALNDGFVAEVDRAAERLYQLDPNSSRNVCVYAIVHLKNERLNEAERVLRSFLEKSGDDGSVLTNLAKVFAARGETKKQDETLWYALTIDPNQDNALRWYEALSRERSGEEAALDGLLRVAQHPNSWLPQLWLARAALKANDLPLAINYYREGLSHAGSNIPADLLMQMSGDLGNHGHLAELLALTEPYFAPEQHGLQVGNNLIKANVKLGHIDVARKILDQLYSLQRPDWKETLSYWDTEIAKTQVAKTVELTEPLSITMLSIEGPVWLKLDSPAAKIFPLTSKDGPLITFLGSSATTSNRTQGIGPQIADAPGRMSRALPLFLAEQVSFASEAKVQTFIPWISEGSGGFVLSGVAWTDGDALECVRRSESKTKYVVVTHLTTGSDPWSVDLRVLQTSSGERVAELQSFFAQPIPGEPVIELSHRLINLITEQLHVKGATIPLYRVPDTESIPNYLLRLEQLLAVRCAGLEALSREFLYVEREIIDGNLQLCLTCPDNIASRILLVQTLLTMNKIKPEVVREFIERVAMLQKDKPLAEPAQTIVQQMLSDLSQ